MRREPQLQNIPVRTETGRKLREALAKSSRLFDFNYAEAELRFFASMTEEEREAFLANPHLRPNDRQT